MASNILVIPDCQVKEGDPLEHLAALGSYIVKHRPDIIVNLGDFYDFPSLSSYDMGTKKAEGNRIYQDIAAGNAAMDVLLHKLRKLQAKQKKQKVKIYKPRMVFLLGNHCDRMMRYVNENPELAGFLDYSHLALQDWEVYDFLKPIKIEGILFAHYFYQPNTGRPIGGAIANRLNKIKESFVQGHEQTLLFDRHYTLERVITGLVAGSFYQHDEGYKSHQGNTHWRGCLMLHDVSEGDYRLEELPIDFIMEKYL